jgi:oligopeptidase A
MMNSSPTTRASLNELTDFNNYDIATIGPTIDACIEHLKQAISQAHNAAPTWKDFVEPLDLASERLSRAWGVVNHLNGVADSEPLRAAYEQKLGDVTEIFTQIGQDQKLFEQYKSLKAGPEWNSLNKTRQRIVDKALQGFELGGAALEGTARARYAQLQLELATLGQDFSKRSLDATNAFTHLVTDAALLVGLPADVIAAARAEAQAKEQDGWLLTLRMPCYIPVMQYCSNQQLRETMYRAYSTRASEFGAPELDNSQTILDILNRRHEEAKLLGFEHFAQLSLETKMASSAQQVVQFLSELTDKSKPFALKEFEQLKTYATTHLGLNDLAPWDVAYVSEKLKESQYSYSEQEVRQYFQAPKVLEGLFKKIESLFKVRVEPDTAPVWDPLVQFFKIVRVDSGQLVGQFYVDLYARANKRSGAWMDDARGRRVHDQGVQTPIAYLVCNYIAPTDNKPALLTHDEVITMFHEMGHGLHHLLTRIDDLAVSGINGVEWDAVELPSQFMENFCWEWPVVESMSCHIETGEPLPRALFDKMTAAKNFLAAMQTVRQIEFGLLDMRLHSEDPPTTFAQVMATVEAVRAQVAVVMPPSYNRFQNTFGHIFAGGYSAGYYSYKWAEVLSADCYAAFEESPEKVEETGARFLNEILSAGGSRPAIDSFRAFRGRDPQIDALLRHNGLQENPLSESTHA